MEDQTLIYLQFRYSFLNIENPILGIWEIRPSLPSVQILFSKHREPYTWYMGDQTLIYLQFRYSFLNIENPMLGIWEIRPSYTFSSDSLF